MAAKENATSENLDKTSFFWVGLCAICHPGGGAGEYDRDGYPYFDVKTGKFGHELAGVTPGQYDGDYSFLNTSTGAVTKAKWDVTGVSEPDCLLCHRGDRTVQGGKNMNWIWRAATLRGSAALVDSQSNPVPAFAAAATAGQGWFSRMEMAPVPAGKPPKATVLDIDYQKGTTSGELFELENGEVALHGDAIVKKPRDYACWGCHVTPDLKKRGRIWFDKDADVHYAAFNNLLDSDPDNDIAAGDSIACSRCHEATEDHNIGKGNALLGSVQNETDWKDLLTCRDCHLPTSARYDPDAPEPTHPLHDFAGHADKLSCQACHVPNKPGNADLVVDNATTGATIAYKTDAFLSADPLDPTNPDKSAWYPDFHEKMDKDRVERFFPAKRLLSLWWGNWDDNGTPLDKSDDVIAPIALWRIRQITKGQPLAGVTDDNGDGKPEVNRLDEILTYLQALKAPDSHGYIVAMNPVLLKGGHVYHEDPMQASGVGVFEYEGTGIKTESSHPFSTDHNVQPAANALGAIGCQECHTFMAFGQPTPVFDRMILVDPFGEDGKPVYKTLRELTGLDPK